MSDKCEAICLGKKSAKLFFPCNSLPRPNMPAYSIAPAPLTLIRYMRFFPLRHSMAILPFGSGVNSKD